MKINIRMATIEDAASIASLSVELGYDISPDKTKNLIEAITHTTNNVIYVAIIDNKVIGWIHAFITTRLESGAFCEIAGFVVSEKHRSNGIGKDMIQHIKNWCKNQNTHTLKVRCNEKRLEAHNFYLREGFKEVKQQKIFEMEVWS